MYFFWLSFIYIFFCLGTRIGVAVGVLAGVETGVGGRIIMASNSGMTETETGMGGMEVAFNLVPQTQIQDTIPTIRDTIITIIDV